MRTFQITLYVCSVICLSIAAYSYIASKQYSSWVTTKAELVSFYTRNASSPTSGGVSDWGSELGFANYQFYVNGEFFEGNRIMPLQQIYLPRSTISELQPGPINIQYNPENPTISFIYAATPVTQIIILFFASAIAAIISLSAPSLLNMSLRHSLEST